MSRSTAFVTAILTVSILAAFGARVPAQEPASVQTELLAEVRLLRQALESLTGTNARVQIVFGRLQLQEQRTAAAATRLEQASMALDDLNQRAGQINDLIKGLEARGAEGRLQPEELEQIRRELTAARREGERLENERTGRMTAESEAAALLNQEQGRSSDLSRQLDELERQLAKPPQ